MTAEKAMLDFSVSALASIQQAHFIRPSAEGKLLITYSTDIQAKKRISPRLLAKPILSMCASLLESKGDLDLCPLNAWFPGGRPLCVQITMV